MKTVLPPFKNKPPVDDRNLIVVEIANQQLTLPVNENRLRKGISAVLAGEGMERAEISVAVIDDATMRELNTQFLKHDWATDVLSFVLEQDEASVEGEIIVSADTAERMAKVYGWAADDEMLLYAIHGALHLVGYDDQTPEAQTTMRERERIYLAGFGLRPRYKDRP
jgi:probable rRNA maturation factor